MEASPENRRNELTVVPYSSAGWNVILYFTFLATELICSCDRQNSVGTVVLFNRQNNRIQLSTNAYSLENGVNHSPSTGGICPTCHRPLHDEPAPHSPAFMDSEYFRMLSSVISDVSSDDNNELRADADTDNVSTGADDRPPGSLPSSAFNQGYFEQLTLSVGDAHSDSSLFNRNLGEVHVVLS
jgi:hypothetical protein